MAFDTSLASLFNCAARPVSADAEGLARARSATEAFFFRRLESLVEPNGGSALNPALPIVSDGAGGLEVHLLCADTRVAVELDRAQQLSDPVARTSCSRRMAASSCAFLLKTSARSWMSCSMPFCGI